MRSTVPLLFAAALLGGVVGCGSGDGPRTGPRQEDPDQVPVPTTVAVPDPEVELELMVQPFEGVKEYALDMVEFTVRVKTSQPADLQVPGPPFLRLDIRDKESGSVLPIRPHPLRPRPPRHFPLSLEAGESLELGPFALDFLAVDPLALEAGKTYVLEMEYRSGDKARPRTAAHEAVLITSRDLVFPDRSPLDAATPARTPVPLNILDGRGRPRRVYSWSPDKGLQTPQN